jgi:hypothetical protein
MNNENREPINQRLILFSGEMVGAILDGRKTQTRRIVKNLVNTVVGTDYCFHETKDGKWEVGFDYVPETGAGCFLRYINCPYGRPGDRLWVRETFHQHYSGGVLGGRPCYKADAHCKDTVIGWKPSIFMPRWASRILLEVVSVRVERVQDISLADINAEGTPDTLDPQKRPFGSRHEQFQRLWDSINEKKHPWESNPWVWVVEFKRIEG